MDCAITLNTQPGKRINIRFDYFDLAPAWDGQTNQCRTEGSSTDSFRIYESGKIGLIRTDVLQPDVTLCGGTGKFPPDYQSSGNVVTVRFTTDDLGTNDAGIKFVYTSFTPPEGRYTGSKVTPPFLHFPSHVGSGHLSSQVNRRHHALFVGSFQPIAGLISPLLMFFHYH